MDKVKDGLEELRKGSKAAGVRIGLCVLLIVGKGISVAPYADKRLGHNGEHILLADAEEYAGDADLTFE